MCDTLRPCRADHSPCVWSAYHILWCAGFGDRAGLCFLPPWSSQHSGDAGHRTQWDKAPLGGAETALQTKEGPQLNLRFGKASWRRWHMS